jgi:hypothetical protein
VSGLVLTADTYLLKLQHLQNNILRTTEHFSRWTPVRDFHTAFNTPYVYGYITKLCRQQAEVIKNHENEHVCSIGQGGATYRKHKYLYMGLKLGDAQAYDRSSH